jgi:hypothetical protein
LAEEIVGGVAGSDQRMCRSKSASGAAHQDRIRGACGEVWLAPRWIFGMLIDDSVFDVVEHYPVPAR